MGKCVSCILSADFLSVIIAFVVAGVAQLVRASGCGSEGRGFDPHHSPQVYCNSSFEGLFCFMEALQKKTPLTML